MITVTIGLDEDCYVQLEIDSGWNPEVCGTLCRQAVDAFHQAWPQAAVPDLDPDDAE